MYNVKPVLVPDRFPGDTKVNIVSDKDATIPADEAMNLFATVLRNAGYTIIDRKAHLQIVQARDASALPVFADGNKSPLESNAVFTKVLKLQHADVEKMSSILSGMTSSAGQVKAYSETNKLVITDYGTNLSSMLNLLKELDQPGKKAATQSVAVENTSPRHLERVARNYLESLTKSASPVEKERWENFSVQVNERGNELLLTGYPQQIKKIKNYVSAFDQPLAKKGRQFHIYDVLHRDAQKLKKTLESALKASSRRQQEKKDPIPQIIADEANNSLVTIATTSEYERIQRLLKDMDAPKKQVEIVAALIELSTDKLADLGVELTSINEPGENPRGFAGTVFGLSEITKQGRQPVPPQGGGLTTGIFKDTPFKIPLLIRLAKREEDVSFVAAPRVTTVDDKEATMQIAERREFQKSIISPEGRTSAVTSGGFNEAATKLQITPHVNEQGGVRMEIKTQVDQFLSSRGGKNNLTTITERTAETQVTTANGGTIVIGGLTRTTDKKEVQSVPFLGSIPYLGTLFRREIDTKQQRNLYIFITPHIHEGQKAIARDTTQKRKRIRRKTKSRDMPLPVQPFKSLTGSEESQATREQGTSGQKGKNGEGQDGN